jgi:PAS domain S-box-containing protein
MELSDTQRLLLAAVEFSDDAIITKTLDGIITSWNKAAEHMFGFSAPEAVGQPILIVVPENRHAEERDILVRLNNGDRIEHFETVRKSKTGRLIEVSLSVSPVRSSTGELIGAAKILRDISRQKENDRILRQAQKMEVVGQLTGGVAHDFNNILAVIMGTIEIIGDEVGDRPDLRAVVNMIDAAATRGAELTARLLAFARKQPLSPLAIDVNMLLQQTVGLLKHTVPENIELDVDLKPHIAPAMVDPDQLVTALLNLAVNSRDAMPDGGKLTIETSDASFDEDYIAQNSEAQPGRYLMIAVSDNGCGIPEQIKEKVFEPFFTTKDVGKGTGLGLSMVYGFVKQSQGHIKIYSEVNVGTTIKIYLPQADRDAQSFSKTEVEIVRGADERVLVVEDDELVRETTTRQLRSLGYEVQAVANAKDALGYLKEYQGVDLLLTDVVMSGSTNGRRLAEEAKQLLPELKVVFMSGYTENAIIHHGRLDAGILLISKPFRRADLARIIRRALD